MFVGELFGQSSGEGLIQLEHLSPPQSSERDYKISPRSAVCITGHQFLRVVRCFDG